MFTWTNSSSGGMEAVHPDAPAVMSIIHRTYTGWAGITYAGFLMVDSVHLTELADVKSALEGFMLEAVVA